MNKVENNRENLVRVRMSDHEVTKLKAFAKKRGATISHILREYVRRLPNP
jgi:predicted DNA-binding protein